MLLEFNPLKIQAGQQILLDNVSWQQLDNFLTEFGEHPAVRLSYSHGLLEIMVPLPEHEKAKEIIGDMVKILLNEQGRNYESLGSTTLKNAQMTQAVEPDACFYIQNQAAIIGKERLDLTLDPPPDLAIEIDLTSRTRLEHYQRLGVLELWRYSSNGLEIHLLQGGQYITSEQSPTFPNIPIIKWVNQSVEESKVSGSSQALQMFRNWVKTLEF
ncbi:Uma2 family endonuclease [Roseofilum capinflatum]|uniref:Uma2 family endonuclease n=1 Tax=Roseofilum capinflatum BLCC-M114 TaxID=3022440 RepID=A0ABT7B6U3_9CYAN|nr:Uma2 family endonuclease [Roseofilum capinflatum]MDJ1174349.1 Uma2 family endonuclease [Roseofilum capinflatum BLCC-M114]